MPATPALLDRFMPDADVRGRHETLVRAPAGLVMDVARNFEIESLWLVHTLFRLRATLLRASEPPPQPRAGFIAQMQALGWGCLAEDPARFYIAGCSCRPWQGNPSFTPIDAASFAVFAEPDCVKIAWTLEAAALGPERTRFATETRVASTDAQSRIKFRRYWRKFGAGIVLIRLVLLPAIRRRAEKTWREQTRCVREA